LKSKKSPPRSRCRLPIALLSFKEARARAAGLSESTVRRRIHDGTFPAPIVLSMKGNGIPGRIGFVADEVDAWVRKTIKDARAPKAEPEPQAQAAAAGGAR
jgi:predicted DNA-binding transcriptional regulator AlpA